jgi:hypothetical protein
MSTQKPPVIKPNTKILNPNTGDYFFGYIPELADGLIDEGPIILRHGQHFSRNRGYGASHIWAAHGAELKKLGYLDIDAIARYVAEIIKPDMPIYVEMLGLDGSYKLTVLRTSKGLVVLEAREDGDGQRIYSVVTAYTKRTAYGTLVGKTKMVP